MSERDEEERAREERGFVVVDRRGGRDEEEAEAPEPAAAEPPPDAPGAAAGGPPPGVDFAMVVHSFAISALYHLGVAPDPETGQPAEPNLPLARQNIDILSVLHEKTRGNLEPEEAKLLEGLLYEVRMHFVEVSKGGA